MSTLQHPTVPHRAITSRARINVLQRRMAMLRLLMFLVAAVGEVGFAVATQLDVRYWIGVQVLAFACGVTSTVWIHAR